MKIKLKNTAKAIAGLEEFKTKVHKVIIDRLMFIGLRFVSNARTNGNYLDHTGNLRSSIGYIVLYNGKIVSENFQEIGTGTDGNKGKNKGRRFATQIAERYTRGYSLIVVAGMEYAAAVESKGRDVLTGSSIMAKNELTKAIKDIKQLASNKR